MVYVRDPSDGAFRYVEANASACRVLGRVRADVVGRTNTELFGAEAAPLMDDFVVRCCESRADVPCEHALPTPGDGVRIDNWKLSSAYLTVSHPSPVRVSFNGQLYTASPLTFDYYRPPVLSLASPSSGPLAGARSRELGRAGGMLQLPLPKVGGRHSRRRGERFWPVDEAEFEKTLPAA